MDQSVNSRVLVNQWNQSPDPIARGRRCCVLFSSCEQAILPRSFKVPRVGHTSIAITVLAAAHLLGLPYMLGKLDRAHAFGAYRVMAVGRNGRRAEKQKMTFLEEGATFCAI